VTAQSVEGNETMEINRSGSQPSAARIGDGSWLKWQWRVRCVPGPARLPPTSGFVI